MWLRASHEFWLSDREVTHGQFIAFLSDEKAEEAYQPEGGKARFNKSDPSLPVSQVSWYEAVMFCNWLSRQEGFDACYRKDGKDKFSDNLGGHDEHDAWKLDPRGTGYRLPTQHEWEYACRARTITNFYFGDDATLLDHYEVYSKNSVDGPFVGGRLMCNAWGLFDMLGNEREWCHDTFGMLLLAGWQSSWAVTARSQASECRPGSRRNHRAIDGLMWDRASAWPKAQRPIETDRRANPQVPPATKSPQRIPATRRRAQSVENETYRFEGGVFSRHAVSGGRWTESKTDGSASYDIHETTRDQDWIYLYDPARRISIRIPISGGLCYWSTDGATWCELCHVSATHLH